MPHGTPLIYFCERYGGMERGSGTLGSGRLKVGITKGSEVLTTGRLEDEGIWDSEDRTDDICATAGCGAGLGATTGCGAALGATTGCVNCLGATVGFGATAGCGAGVAVFGTETDTPGAFSVFSNFKSFS